MKTNAITLYRASGHPIENPEVYLEQLNKKMDELGSQELPADVDKHLWLQDTLTKWHDEYIINNPISTTIPEPTRESIEELCAKYGSIAFCTENHVTPEGEVVESTTTLTAYILDR